MVWTEHLWGGALWQVFIDFGFEYDHVVIYKDADL